MELILELFYERRRSCFEWKPIICAMLLALSLGGMYRYLSAHTDYRAETAKRDAAVAMPEIVADMEIDTKSYIHDLFETEAEKSVPDVAPAISETAEDAGNIPNVIAEDEPETLRPAKNRKKKKAVAIKADAAKDPIASSVSIDAVEDPVLPPVSMPVDDGAEKVIENIVKFPEPVVTREISGFICNDKGHITGYTDPSKFLKDSLVVLPRDNACTGIMKGAFKGLEDKISEIYIPANITYIEAGAFETLYNLIFIEVNPKNPEFYSANGILYCKDGKVVAHPNRLM